MMLAKRNSMLAAFATDTRRDHLLDAAVCSLTSSTTRPWNRRSLPSVTSRALTEALVNRPLSSNGTVSSSVPCSRTWGVFLLPTTPSIYCWICSSDQPKELRYPGEGITPRLTAFTGNLQSLRSEVRVRVKDRTADLDGMWTASPMRVLLISLVNSLMGS